MASTSYTKTIDGRSQRVDFATTLGEPWATTVCVTDGDGDVYDLTGAVVIAALLDGAGAELVSLSPNVDVATGCVTLSITGATTVAAPLGVGSWAWFLRVQLPTEDEGSYWLGGSFAIHRIASYAARTSECGPDVVGLCVGSQIVLAVESCQGTQGAAGGQAHVGPLPPANLAAGMMWVMTPVDHIAQYTASGWKPLWPPTDNEAVATGDAMLGIDGLWVASEGS
jgi:hypothetical protein